jgi:hypothetical protein
MGGRNSSAVSPKLPVGCYECGRQQSECLRSVMGMILLPIGGRRLGCFSLTGSQGQYDSCGESPRNHFFFSDSHCGHVPPLGYFVPCFEHVAQSRLLSIFSPTLVLLLWLTFARAFRAFSALRICALVPFTPAEVDGFHRVDLDLVPRRYLHALRTLSPSRVLQTMRGTDVEVESSGLLEWSQGTSSLSGLWRSRSPL